MRVFCRYNVKTIHRYNGPAPAAAPEDSGRFQTIEDLDAYQVAREFRKVMYPDQVKFLLQARGSLEELIDDLNVGLDEDFVPSDEIETLKSLGWRAHKVLNGCCRYLRRKKAEQTSALKESPVGSALEAEDDDPFGEARCNVATL